MTLTAAEIAEMVSGVVYRDTQAAVCDVSSLNQPRENTLSFLTDLRDIRQIATTVATILLLPENCEPEKVTTTAQAIICVKDPFSAFMQMMVHFRQLPEETLTGVAPSAQVDPSAVVGADVLIGPNCVIAAGCQIGEGVRLHSGVTLGANVVLGNEVILYPNVVIYAGCVLQDRVMVHAGSVIGADGFGYRFHAGQYVKLPHYGRVILEEDVEIGACTTIDRGMIDDTRIGRGTKIDNQVMIGHNCQIGQYNVIVSQVGLAGSVTTGDYCRFGGQVGIADHVKIGKNSSLVAQAGVFRDIEEGETMAGSPAVPMNEQKKIALAALKLPEMRQNLRQLQKQVEKLQQQVSLPLAQPSPSVCTTEQKVA